MAIVFQIALTGLEYASSGSITTEMSDSAAPNCSIAQLYTSFKTTDCLTITVKVLASEIIATADGVIYAVVVCVVLAIEWETDEWSGQSGSCR